MTSQILASIRPIDGQSPAQLILQQAQSRDEFDLPVNLPLTITPDFSTKYCTGWHDIGTHQGHSCPDAAIVDNRHEQCYPCRQRTDFNPAFYNTTDISDKQAAYNNSPHSVYIAYFGGGLAKAGISADSRGLRRLREQGAWLYVIVDSFPDATIAHYHEDQLIKKGLRNSVSRRQKANVLRSAINIQHEAEAFQSLLKSLELPTLDIVDQLDDYFYGAYPDATITPTTTEPISGTVRGVVGRYLVLENNQRLYGYWLDSLRGYPLAFSSDIMSIEAQPEQVSLF